MNACTTRSSGRPRPRRLRSARGGLPASRATLALPLAALAAVLGCTSAGGDRPPVDAGATHPPAADAAADRRVPKDAGRRDGRSPDAHPRDARAGDVCSDDAGSDDGGSGEAGSGDAGSDDADSPDAGAGDATCADATSGDALADDGGQPDATSADAAASDADASPSASTTFSISPLSLVPPFSTAIHNYYVRCAAGTNDLTVSMTAAPGSTIGLVQPMVTPQSSGSSMPLTSTRARPSWPWSRPTAGPTRTGSGVCRTTSRG